MPSILTVTITSCLITCSSESSSFVTIKLASSTSNFGVFSKSPKTIYTTVTIGTNNSKFTLTLSRRIMVTYVSTCSALDVTRTGLTSLCIFLLSIPVTLNTLLAFRTSNKVFAIALSVYHIKSSSIVTGIAKHFLVQKFIHRWIIRINKNLR